MLRLSLEKERHFFFSTKEHSLKDFDQCSHVLQIYARCTKESSALGTPLLCEGKLATVDLPAASLGSRAGRDGSCSHSVQNRAEMIIFK